MLKFKIPNIVNESINEYESHFSLRIAEMRDMIYANLF